MENLKETASKVIAQHRPSEPIVLVKPAHSKLDIEGAVLIHPNELRPAWYRLSFRDKRGFVGDCSSPSIVDAVMDAFELGYTQPYKRMSFANV